MAKKQGITLDEARRKLKKAVRPLHVPKRDETKLLDHLFESGQFVAVVGDGRVGWVNRDLLNKDKVYAVHNEDLDLLSKCADVLSELPDVLTNPIPLIADLLLFLFKYRRKRAELTALQGAILLALKKSKGMGIESLVRKTNARLGPGTRRVLALDVSSVEVELRRLEKVRLKDGTTTAFVAEDGGRWVAVDV